MVLLGMRTLELLSVLLTVSGEANGESSALLIYDRDFNLQVVIFMRLQMRYIDQYDCMILIKRLLL